MKHFFRNFVLIIFLLSVTGCFRSASEQNSEEMAMESYTGVISVLPQATQNLFEASNAFEVEGGEIIYIRSLIYDLADPVYKNALLKIDGVPRVVNGKKTLTIDKVEVLEEGSPLADLNFVEFKDAKLGVLMKVPDILTVDAQSTKLKVTGELLEGVFTIERHDILDELAYDQPTVDEFSEVEIGANKVTAFLDKNTLKGYHYIVYMEDFVYEVSFVPTGTANELKLALELLEGLDFLPVDKNEEDKDENEDVKSEDSAEDNSDNTASDPVVTEPAEETTDISSLDLSKFNQLESLPLEFSVYYPNSWYYAQVGKGYAFAKDPVEEGNWIAYIEVAKDDSVEIDKQWLVMKRKINNREFVVYGEKDSQKALETILASLAVVKSN